MTEPTIDVYPSDQSGLWVRYGMTRVGWRLGVWAAGTTILVVYSHDHEANVELQCQQDTLLGRWEQLRLVWQHGPTRAEVETALSRCLDALIEHAAREQAAGDGVTRVD